MKTVQVRRLNVDLPIDISYKDLPSHPPNGAKFKLAHSLESDSEERQKIIEARKFATQEKLVKLAAESSNDFDNIELAGDGN